ncbi:MAG TPA: RdgB/HAM1 family non-canonical purine NTP pyrophosphatase [Bacteroidales bacterium]|nr:RdgB/HAM1 family non-canonical purine NTP pyrophosphatase [Bacteroidales bacterium]
MELVFASYNQSKVEEVSKIMGAGFRLLSLRDIGCHDPIPEPYNTLEENALAKARFVFEKYGLNCFADDSGLEVDALGGMPGVNSAHFAGLDRNPNENIQKLLAEMEGVTLRTARFRAVLALIIQNKEYLFEGTINGMIATEPKGVGGFGYDPVFLPEGFNKTFGELPATIKNSLSHRARALEKMLTHLRHCPPD